MAATDNQKKLFDLISDFTASTVLGWVTCAYAAYGKTITGGNGLPQLLLSFAEEYFNNCARWIYSREDAYINEKFDEMTSISLEGKNDPADVLHIIVMLSLNILNSLDIKNVIGDNPRISLEAVNVHVRALLRRYTNLATNLCGCSRDHVHEPVQANEKTFSFTIDQYAQTNNGPVKLTYLEL